MPLINSEKIEVVTNEATNETTNEAITSTSGGNVFGW
jgi:hypothetical protein